MLQAGVGQYPCAGVRGQHWAGEGGFTGPREGNFTGPRERNITGPREGNITGPREGNITRPRERNTHGALRSCGNSALLRKARRIHISQLSKKKAAITVDDDLILFSNSTIYSNPLAIIKKGRLVKIIKCKNEWCKINTDEFKGWLQKKSLWGLI